MTTAFSNYGHTAVPEILPPGAHEPHLEAVVTDPLARAFPLLLTLTLEVPVVRFTVGSLMALALGTTVETGTHQDEDLALRVNGQMVGPVEIEVLGDNLAVRLTGIA